MTKHAQLPDGTVLEFPDDTPDAVMDKAVKSHLGGANNSDIANLVSGKHKSGPVEQFRDNLRRMPQGGMASAVIDAGDAVQHHAMNAVRGVGQLGAHGLEAGLSALGLDSFAAKQHAVNVNNDASLRQREADYQRRTPDGAASYAGAAAGEVLPWMYGAGELRALGMLPKVSAGGLAGLAQKIGLLAAEGGGMGAATPVIGDGSYASQKGVQVAVGAAAAPALAGGLKGAGAVARVGRYLTPGGREAIANERVAKLYGDEPNILDQLRAGSGIPGYELTPAQALATPKAVQTERALRNNGMTAPAFADRESLNNAVSRQAVANVAGTDDALQAAQEARRKATQAFREKSLPEKGSALVDPSAIVDKLHGLALSGNDTVRQAARKHLGLLQEHMSENGGKIPATALDDIRQGVGSTLRSIPQHGAVTPQEVVRYAPVSTAITDALGRAVPGYRAHLAAYAHHSQPINDMEAGRALLAAIDSGGRDAGGNQAVSLNQVKALIAKDNRAEFPMSESARKQIEAVLGVLQKRSVTNNTIAATGPGTAADLQRAIQGSPLLMRLLGHGAAGVGGMHFGPLGVLAGAGMVEGANALNNQVARKVGEKAASSRLTADAIEAARNKPPRGLNGLAQLLPWEDPALLPPPR